VDTVADFPPFLVDFGLHRRGSSPPFTLVFWIPLSAVELPGAPLIPNASCTLSFAFFVPLGCLIVAPRSFLQLAWRQALCSFFLLPNPILLLYRPSRDAAVPAFSPPPSFSYIVRSPLFSPS